MKSSDRVFYIPQQVPSDGWVLGDITVTIHSTLPSDSPKTNPKNGLKRLVEAMKQGVFSEAHDGENSNESKTEVRPA